MSTLKLLRNIPFVRFSFALATGIFVADYFNDIPVSFLGVSVGISFLLLLCVVFLSFFYQSFKNRWLCGSFFFAFLIQCGLVLASFSTPTQLKGDYQIEATGKVIEADITYSGYFRFTVAPQKVKSYNKKVPLGANDYWQIIVAPPDSIKMLPAVEGNKISFKTRLSGHSKVSNPLAFDYGQYLYRQGISGSGFVDSEDFKVIERSELDGVWGNIKQMRNQTRQIYLDNGITGEKLQILSALTLGMRNELSDEVKSRFVHSGAVHILAVSGLHVGIVFLFLNSLLSIFLPSRSFFRMLIVVAGLAFYALLTGGAPSVFRAVVMLSVIQVGKYYNLNGNVYNLLGISAFIILLVQPMALFHAGFWLSHLAVAGIVTFYPVFRRLYAGGNVFVRSVGDIAAVSLSAQIGTLPLSIFLFRAFPSWFLLTNFLILPLVAPILVLANLLVTLNGSSFLAAMVAGLLIDILDFMNKVVTWLDSLPFAYIQGLWIGIFTVLLMYTFITSMTIWFQVKNRSFFLLSLLALLGISIMINVEYLEKKNTNSLVVFDTGRNNTIGLVSSGKGFLYKDSLSTERQMNFSCSGFFSKYAFNVEKKNLFDNGVFPNQVSVFPVFGGCYLGVGKTNVDLLQPAPGQYTNVLGIIIMGDVKGNVAGLLERFNCDKLIINKTCPPWCIDKWQNEVMDRSIMVHSVYESGAYTEFY